MASASLPRICKEIYLRNHNIPSSRLILGCCDRFGYFAIIVQGVFIKHNLQNYAYMEPFQHFIGKQWSDSAIEIP
jgi:hypothetical protein